MKKQRIMQENTLTSSWLIHQNVFEKKVDARTWKHRHVINENLESVDKLKKQLKSIQPVYVRMSISDLSKLRIKSL